jgi:hypothetical protein
MIGTWNGYYKYKDKIAQKSVGVDLTYFKIIIRSFDGKDFNGTVTEDLSTGGMEGEGVIIGEVNNNRILFKKLMPKRGILNSDGTKKMIDKPHPTIYYPGTISPDKKHIEGNWEFKWQIIYAFGFIPIPVKPSAGVWSMTLQ